MKNWAALFSPLVFPLALLAGCATTPDGRTASHGQSKSFAIAKVHTELAGMYYERAQMGIALGEIDTALQAERDYAPAYNVRGLIHMALHEYKEAEEDFLQSLRLDKNDSETHNNYGWFLCQRGMEKDSIPHFMAALKNPLYATPERAYLNAGLCAKKAGERKDAMEFLQRALQVRPGMPQALLAMAELSLESGEPSTAKKHFTAFSGTSENLTAEQLWLAVRIERRMGDRNAEASYAMQLRKRFPDAHETRLLVNGK